MIGLIQRLPSPKLYLQVEKSRRIQDLIQRQKSVEEKKFRRQKEARKEVSRTLSKEQARREKMASRGRGRSSRKGQFRDD